MKSLGAALATTLLIIVGAFYGLVYGVDLERNVAAQIAAATIGAVPYIRELLERMFLIQRKSNRVPVVPLGRFGLPPLRMILYGTLVIFGAMELGGGLGGLGAEFLGATNDRYRQRLIEGVIGILIVLPVIFSVGRWVGRRSSSHDIAVILAISFLARLSTTLIDVWLVTPARMTEFLGFDVTPVRLSLIVAAGTMFFVLIGLIGYWRGRRQRMGAYLTYLLQSVSEDTRRAIVDLAFEEAHATRTRGGSASGRGEQASCSA